MELEFNLLLRRCKDIGAKLYLINIPTSENVSNVTSEEQERIDKRDPYFGWMKYLMDKEQYAPLLEEVLRKETNLDEFINSCLNYPLVVEKDQLCYLSEHSDKYFNVVQGNRVTTDVPNHIENVVYVGGNSFVFGPLVDDAHTVAIFL